MEMSDAENSIKSDHNSDYSAEKDDFISILQNGGYENPSDAINALLKPPQYQKESKKKIVRRQKSLPEFILTENVQSEKRYSSRIRKIKPAFGYTDLPDENHISGSKSDTDYGDLEDIVYEIRNKRRSSSTSSKGGPPSRILPVEQVTNEMISQIVMKGNKTYSIDGTSCHQCRQKTVDMKTVCRSGFCTGVRGQFCGICVINRYGEDPIAALRNPNWHCYVCRGVCNCSFCRAKMGKRPTGILFPLAIRNGFKSVHEFLQHLNGYGDYDDSATDEDLLGFESNYAILKSLEKIDLNCDNCDDCKIVTALKINKNTKNDRNDTNYLLGFDDYTLLPVMGENR